MQPLAKPGQLGMCAVRSCSVQHDNGENAILASLLRSLPRCLEVGADPANAEGAETCALDASGHDAGEPSSPLRRDAERVSCGSSRRLLRALNQRSIRREP